MENSSRVFTVSLNTSLDRTFCLDRLVFGDINRVRNSRLDAGGKGLNVARMLHLLNDRVCAVACLGGHNGLLVRALVRAEGVAIRMIKTSGETRNIFNFIEKTTGRVLRINEPGPAFSEKERQALFQYLSRLRLQSEDMVVLSGSLPPGLPVATYREIINLLKPRTSWITLDADGMVLKEGVKAGPWLIKPNLWELQRLLGQKVTSPAGLIRLCHGLLNRNGLRLILLTLGNQGAVAVSPEETVWARPPRIKPVSEIGCGDAFLAGFLHGWRQTQSLKESLKLAVACGTAKVTCAGTSMPSRRQVFALKDRVRLLSPDRMKFSPG
ncbi:MAG TPA: 1-phosphofructokinase family hexose kinase [bacterium]|nr:1-phosphofructokinase family hexose kinase [bacterium]HPP12361.1 1-phosphofructokinase family hexose kinase [bacterium]